MPGLIVPAVKLQHRLRSPATQAGHRGVMPRGAHDSHGLSTTRWPDLEPLGLGPELDHVGHDLVPQHLGERAQAAHGAVAVALEVEEDLLGVGAADAGEAGPDHQPVGA